MLTTIDGKTHISKTLADIRSVSFVATNDVTHFLLTLGRKVTVTLATLETSQTIPSPSVFTVSAYADWPPKPSEDEKEPTSFTARQLE